MSWDPIKLDSDFQEVALGWHCPLGLWETCPSTRRLRKLNKSCALQPCSVLLPEVEGTQRKRTLTELCVWPTWKLKNDCVSQRGAIPYLHWHVLHEHWALHSRTVVCCRPWKNQIYAPVLWGANIPTDFLLMNHYLGSITLSFIFVRQGLPDEKAVMYINLYLLRVNL